MAAGDAFAKPWQVRQHLGDLADRSIACDASVPGRLRQSDLHMFPAQRWAYKNEKMSRRYKGWETFRFGDKIVRFLHQVFPTMRPLYTAKTWDAGAVLPIFLEDLYTHKDWTCYWKDGKGEVLRSQTVFSAIVSVVAMEIMTYYADRSPHHDILCLWFLKKKAAI